MRLMTMIDERKRAQETGEEHSIFTFHADVNRDQQRVRLAKNGARRMKTLRHPNVLLVKDVIEIESGNELTIHVVTEAVTPREAHLREAPIGGGGTGRGMIIFRSGCGKSRRRWRS